MQTTTEGEPLSHVSNEPKRFLNFTRSDRNWFVNIAVQCCCSARVFFDQPVDIGSEKERTIAKSPNGSNIMITLSRRRSQLRLEKRS